MNFIVDIFIVDLFITLNVQNTVVGPEEYKNA